MRWLACLILLAGWDCTAKDAPFFRGELLGGGRASLETVLKPKRLTLLSFWATWCVPCLEELTHVSQKIQSDPALPLELVSVNVDNEQRSEVPATMRQMGFSFPVILDPQKEIFGRYQKASTLPYSVLLSPDGKIVAEFSGYHESMFQEIQRAAKTLEAKQD